MLFESVIIDFLRLLPSYRKDKEKREVRELLAQKRRILTKAEVQTQSGEILAHLEQLPCFKSAKTVLLYYPTHNEVNLLPLIKKYKREKTFLFPVVRRSSMTACPYEGNDKMHRGKYNIPEPTTEPYRGTIDVILVPGVGFDKDGNRLGRGGGYYDRFIGSTRKATQLVGVGYDFQLIDMVPVNRRDKKMNYIITPTAGVVTTKRDH